MLVLPLILERLRVCRRRLDCYVAHDGRYIAIAFVVDSSDARSAEREHKPRARQNRHFSSDYGHPRLRLVFVFDRELVQRQAQARVTVLLRGGVRV